MKAKDRQFIFGIVLMLYSIFLYHIWFQHKTPEGIIIARVLSFTIGCIVCIRTFKD